MSFPSVDRAILSAKDKKNLAGAQELTALLTDLDIQRHKVKHALKDLAEYLPKSDITSEDCFGSVVEKYRSDFSKAGYSVIIEGPISSTSTLIEFTGRPIVSIAIDKLRLHALHGGSDRVLRVVYTIVDVSDWPVCEVKCRVQYDDRVQAFTFYLMQDLVDHLESVFLSLLAG